MIIPAIFKKIKKSPLIKIYAAQILGPLSTKIPGVVFLCVFFFCLYTLKHPAIHKIFVLWILLLHIKIKEW